MRNTSSSTLIQFFYNNAWVTLEQERADLTVLEWLRLHASRVGTKEGCASGDCGACTVVVAKPSNATDGFPLRYEAINSCIAFMGSLNGCALFSVEDLAQGKDLHPVQRAMVQLHGSQCGFCTPGFVMSMFALYQQQRHASERLVSGSDLNLSHVIDRYLGGNLCRCTGYKPIKAAMVQALSQMQDDETDVRVQALAKMEQRIASDLSAAAEVPVDSRNAQSGSFFQPNSLDELSHYKRTYPAARLLAGGTDLALEVTQVLKPIEAIIDLKHVPELLVVDETDQGIRLGAAVSLSRCLSVLENRLPGLKSLLLRYGSEQVRNAGTIGGNIANASPIGDFPPVLIAANATVCLGSPSGSRELSIQDYFKDYKVTELESDEWVQSVFIPKLSEQQFFAVHKISKRLDDDISAVCGAFSWITNDGRLQDVRVAFGGMAAIPKRAAAVEAVLDGCVFSDEIVQRAQAAIEDDFQPISDARASAQYRVTVAKNLIQRVKYDLETADTLTHVLDYDHW